MSFNLAAFDGIFAAGLVHTVAVDVNSNYDGSTLEDRGNVEPNWDGPPVRTALPCRVTQLKSSTLLKDDKPVVEGSWCILYAAGEGIVLDNRHRVRFVDGGVTRYFLVKGRAADEGATGHHRYCELVESI